ncbi:hypothetical protein KIN20_032595 [Parelaphostrongylus tenuis]|uniref:Uncharacterized protein n=1 Tax=Parelaphostrongylus tenuis TaxID=148309 RepID=A0AAD5WHT7_PARTN|nr:hypothetical protein KIN20_032595 [Parelaphostrongylus tenuis]
MTKKRTSRDTSLTINSLTDKLYKAAKCFVDHSERTDINLSSFVAQGAYPKRPISIRFPFISLL